MWLRDETHTETRRAATASSACIAVSIGSPPEPRRPMPPSHLLCCSAFTALHCTVHVQYKYSTSGNSRVQLRIAREAGRDATSGCNMCRLITTIPNELAATRLIIAQHCVAAAAALGFRESRAEKSRAQRNTNQRRGITICVRKQE